MYDIFGKEFLDQKISKQLEDIRLQSFIFNNEVDEVNTIYMKFDNWVSLFFDDGVLFIKEGFDEKPQRIESGRDIIEYRFLDTSSRFDINLIKNKNLQDIRVDNDFEVRILFEGGKELIISQECTSPGYFGNTNVTIT